MDSSWADSHGIAAIYLHGSRAEDRAHQDSDYDVAVLLENPTVDWQETENLRAELATRLSPMLGVSSGQIDVVFMHQAPPAFQYRAIKPGRILWEADNHVRVHFETRLLLEYLDYLYFEDMHDRALHQRIEEGTYGHRPSLRDKATG
jgi:predicted nucleotidyltransferase